MKNKIHKESSRGIHSHVRIWLLKTVPFSSVLIIHRLQFVLQQLISSVTNITDSFYESPCRLAVEGKRETQRKKKERGKKERRENRGGYLEVVATARGKNRKGRKIRFHICFLQRADGCLV